jgi:hypothetical protein
VFVGVCWVFLFVFCFILFSFCFCFVLPLFRQLNEYLIGAGFVCVRCLRDRRVSFGEFDKLVSLTSLGVLVNVVN